MNEKSSQTTAHPSARFHVIAFLAVVALIWGGLVHKLTTDWSTNPQYEFGYFVPFFIFYLLARRWEDRPKAAVKSPVAAVTLVLSLAALLPITAVQEANPDWRPLNWIHAAAAVIATTSIVASTGGGAWARHFGIPLLLVFFCLPWPLAMEQGMIKELTGAVTRVTVELLNWINVPALQRGNVIEVATGSVGVADACSGMRSIAGTLMASAFFGEYYRLNGSRRLLLIICGSTVAFGLNIVRTFFLGWRTAAEGTHAVENWHDPAGYTIFAVSFAALWVLARLVSREGVTLKRATLHTIPSIGIPTPVLGCITLWLGGTHVLTEAWYRIREGKRTPSPEWSVVIPEGAGAFRSSPLPDEVRSILRYSEGTSALVDWPDGRTWNVIVLRWDPGRSSAQLATMHRPEICMPASGHGFVGPAESLKVSSHGIELTFDGTIFDSNGHPLYVYRCLWEEQGGTGRTYERRFDMSIHGRLMSSWYGRRNLGQRLVQIAISGVVTEAEAQEELKRRMPSLIVSET